MPRGSVLKLGQGLAGGSLGLWREASDHIRYKSPGHRYTEHCLARVTATLSEDGPSHEDAVTRAMHAYTPTHKWTGLKMGAWKELQRELEGRLCGSRAGHEVPLEAVNQN